MGDHGAFLCKSRHVLSFAAEEALGDEKGEIGVLDAGLLEHRVEGTLHLFPYGIPVRLDYHTSADSGLLGQICLDYYVVIPL